MSASWEFDFWHMYLSMLYRINLSAAKSFEVRIIPQHNTIAYNVLSFFCSNFIWPWELFCGRDNWPADIKAQSVSQLSSQNWPVDELFTFPPNSPTLYSSVQQLNKKKKKRRVHMQESSVHSALCSLWGLLTRSSKKKVSFSSSLNIIYI